MKKEFFYPILDILFPQYCVLCREKVYTSEITFPVCMDCDNKLIFVHGQKILSSNSTLYFSAKYSDNVKTLIHSFKYEGIKIVFP